MKPKNKDFDVDDFLKEYSDSIGEPERTDVDWDELTDRIVLNAAGMRHEMKPAARIFSHRTAKYITAAAAVIIVAFLTVFYVYDKPVSTLNEKISLNELVRTRSASDARYEKIRSNIIKIVIEEMQNLGLKVVNSTDERLKTGTFDAYYNNEKVQATMQVNVNIGSDNYIEMKTEYKKSSSDKNSDIKLNTLTSQLKENIITRLKN